MSDKQWNTYEMEVNGLKYNAKFTDKAINEIFLPFLKKLTDLQAQLDRKVVAYLAAPPAAGKTILSKFLERLSKEHSDLTDICALGIDGFHFSNDYMNAHFAIVNGSTIPMKMIKGAPETFDVDTLHNKIREVRQDDTKWSIYDRNIHDILPDAISVNDADIILIEGNYLLLQNPKWTNIRVLADYSVFVKADTDMLKTRLIERKIRGGKTQSEAEHFYNTSDGKNVELVLNNSAKADENWIVETDGDFSKLDDED